MRCRFSALRSYRQLLACLRSLKAQDFDAWRRREDLTEGMHPVAGFLRRADAAATDLIKLIEVGQLDLELERRAVAVAAGLRHQQSRIQALAVRGLDLSLDEIDRALAIDRQHVVR